MFPYTFLPSITPSYITCKLFSSNIISLASFAMSVAESTQIPTSAVCSDGASFTPSPIYPTTWPFFLYVFTTLSFCNGFNLAKTSTSSTAFSNSSSDILSNSTPVIILSDLNPTVLHIFFVAYALSPVRIFVFTPIFLKSFIVFFTSFFGGSKNATYPTNVISLSSLLLKTFTPGYSFFVANAITCIPRFDKLFAFTSICFIKSSVIGIISSLYFTCLQHFKISSIAPFVSIL